MLRVSVLGATGYTGGELLRLLAHHPHARRVHATTTTRPGMELGDAHPALRGVLEGTLEPFDAARVAADSDIVLSCLPHKESMGAIAAIVAENPKVKVVDLSGDFRFKDAQAYQAAYGVPHAAPHLLPKAAYGIPELFRDAVAKATIVANPGCYPTSTLIPLAPLARSGLLKGDLIVDSKSGVSGAGATPRPDTHYAEANENLKAYSPLVHRHEPEMEEQLSAVSGGANDIHFVPHLVPMTRGILTTIYATLAKPHKLDDVHGLLATAYDEETFVRILPTGTLPETKNTTGTNFIDIGAALHPNGTRLVLVAALDNLVKGASGQAIQNLNLLAGLPETTGLLPNHATKSPKVIA